MEWPLPDQEMPRWTFREQMLEHFPAGPQPRTHPSFGQIPVVDEAGRDHGLLVLVAAVAVVEPREGAELGPGEGEADLAGAACGSRR